MFKIQGTLGLLGIKFIQFWVKTFGKTISIKDEPWLQGPIGPNGAIGDKPYDIIAKQENLSIINDPNGALVPDIGILNGKNFDANNCEPLVKHFYENTAQYDLDVWAETRFPGRLFLWIIVTTVSRYMNQLNFPIFGLDTSKGMSSEIISLKDKEGNNKYTGWFRKIKDSGRVIYTGFYSNVQAPNYNSKCVKVVFPLPNGNATVILKPIYDEQGKFNLISSGKQWGDPGFYRMVALDENKYKVLYMKNLKEKFVVYEDEEGVLRCNHDVRFLGMIMLKLHYRMRLKNQNEKF